MDITKYDNDVYQNIRGVLAKARTKAYSAINSAMVEAYWEIGRQIEEAVGERAEYGKGLLIYLARQLTAEFGKGFSERSLRVMRQFFATFPIRRTLCAELSWSHYRLLIRIENEQKREFYTRECAESNWSVRQLERQINSFFYERLLATQKSGKESVKNEINQLEPKITPDYIIKDPYILEFLDLKENRDYHETELEQALIEKLQDFLLELGKGFRCKIFGSLRQRQPIRFEIYAVPANRRRTKTRTGARMGVAESQAVGGEWGRGMSGWVEK